MITFSNKLSSGDYVEFSNNYIRPMIIDGKLWLSVQHYYQAMKSDIPSMREAIRLAPTAEEAVNLGLSVSLTDDWDNLRYSVMKTALLCKFTQHPDLLSALVKDSFGEDIVFKTKKDYYWGIGKDGTGQNKLGVLLVELREFLDDYFHDSDETDRRLD